MPNELLQTFWLELPGGHVSGLRRFGVTALSLDDALQLLRTAGFDLTGVRDRLQIREGVRWSDLDPNHVLPNSLPMNVRGVWYPMTSSWAHQR